MSNSTPVKNGLILAVDQTMGVWFVNDGCNFMKFIEWCLVPCVLSSIDLTTQYDYHRDFIQVK